ncbi:tetratricopeptide repeat protein [Desulfonauticus submarinus]
MAEAINYVKICERISKISIYLLAFLLPIFFLPWAGSILAFNKQALLVFLVFVSFFAWMLKILISGKFKFTFSWVHIPLVVFFLVLLFVTLFSLYPYGSFWGWPMATGLSFLTVISFVLLYFLLSSALKREEVFYFITFLLFSSFLAMLYGVFQVFGKYLLPFAFSKTPSFNTVGTTGSLAILAAVLLPLFGLLIIKVRKGILRMFFALSVALIALVLILVNFFIAWWLVVVGAVLMITLIAQKRDILDNRWLILPMFFLAISLLFIFLNPQIPGIPNRPVEIFLNQHASAGIAFRTLKEHPVLGTGQGTFAFDFAKYKDTAFNKSKIWNVKFGKSGSEFFNDLTTTGILGSLAFLVLMGLSIFYGIKVLFIDERKRRKNQEKAKNEGEALAGKAEKEINDFFWVLSAGIFVSFLVLSVAYFLYGLNLTLNFVYFVLLATFVGLVFSGKEFILKPSSLPTLIFTFGFTLFFVFGLGIFILEAQRYIAAVDYQQGISASQKGKAEDALNKISGAARMNPGVDLYWRQLAQLYVSRANQVSQDKKLSKDKAGQMLQAYINNAVNSAKAAVDTSPENVANWSTRAYVFQKLVGLINGSADWAVKSYESASRLDPLNPYYPTQEGIVYVQEASLLDKKQKDEKTKLLEKAKNQFEKAIKLKPDYAPANFQLAMVYQMEGKQKEAIKKLEATQMIAPFDVGVAFQLGLTYYQTKNYKKARSEFERALTLNQNYSTLYFLGLTYNKLNMNNMAIKVFEKVAKLNPKNKQVKKILENLKSGKDIMEGLVKKKPAEVPIKEEEKKK